MSHSTSSSLNFYKPILIVNYKLKVSNSSNRIDKELIGKEESGPLLEIFTLFASVFNFYKIFQSHLLSYNYKGAGSEDCQSECPKTHSYKRGAITASNSEKGFNLCSSAAAERMSLSQMFHLIQIKR